MTVAVVVVAPVGAVIMTGSSHLPSARSTGARDGSKTIVQPTTLELIVPVKAARSTEPGSSVRPFTVGSVTAIEDGTPSVSVISAVAV